MLTPFLLYGPLEQFDAASWPLLGHFWTSDSVDDSLLVYSQSLTSYDQHWLSAALRASQEQTYILILLLATVVLAGPIAARLGLPFGAGQTPATSVVSLHISVALLGSLLLLTGAPLFMWSKETTSIIEEVGVGAFSDVASILPADFKRHLALGVDVVPDEGFISLLLGLFLLSGPEEADEEEFVLETEEPGFVAEMTAPLFISNLGRDVEDNGGLFVKICTIFSFVLLNNLMGMLPYSDTGTSSLALTFYLSLSFFGVLISLMLLKRGIHHLFSQFLPAGSTLALVFLLVPIELVSYVFRVVSLPVRLFANMMAGHTLLKVIVGFSWGMILAGNGMLVANLAAIAILFILNFLELGVALIQTYIFTILSCIYLKDIYFAH